jgi:PKD repeat protein
MKKAYSQTTTFIILLISIITNHAVAQPANNICGADHYYQELVRSHPEILQNQAELDAFTANFEKKKNKSGRVTYVIPVVVHIMHNYGPENIPAANVHDAIRIMNEDLQAKQPDTAGIAPAFKSILGGFDVELRLATKDPNGNCTDGINRVFDPVYTYEGGYLNGSYNGFPPIQWPRDKYFNIWVVNDIDVPNGFLGYSSFPSFAAGGDGVVIEYTVFGSLPPSSTNNFNARYMSHEVGHYLNLCHIWSCPSANGLPSNCNEDDGVADTPNTIGTTNCNLSFSSCGSLDNVQNFMDYSYGACASGLMFTADQVMRMEAALNSTVGSRNNLWSPANLLATGTDDATYANIPLCAPIADFYSPDQNNCTGNMIFFEDKSFNAPYDPATWNYSWSFPGGTPSTSTARNPGVTYNQPGQYDVTLTVTNAAGSSQPLTKSNYVTITQGAGTFEAPYTDKISEPSWPSNPDPSLEWGVIKPQGSLFQFQRTTNASYSPPSSIYLNNFSYNGNDDHELIFPIADLSNLQSGSAYLKFQVAYSRKASENEILILYVSDDCGKTFNFEKIWASPLFVSPNSPNSGAFVPADTSEWVHVVHDISAYAGLNNIQFKLVFDAKQGNNLFLDDISISDNPNPEPITNLEAIDEKSVLIYPNPNEGSFRLEFQWDGNEEVNASIINIVGESVQINLNDQTSRGWNSIDIDTRELGLQPGIYFLNLSSGESSLTKRLIIE